jgi:hypothetical protein
MHVEYGNIVELGAPCSKKLLTSGGFVTSWESTSSQQGSKSHSPYNDEATDPSWAAYSAPSRGYFMNQSDRFRDRDYVRSICLLLCFQKVLQAQTDISVCLKQINFSPESTTQKIEEIHSPTEMVEFEDLHQADCNGIETKQTDIRRCSEYLL